MKKAGKPRHHQSHDAGIKQVNRDIIGVALNELRLFNLWMHSFKSDRFFFIMESFNLDFT
jgi:hypothetical protein